MYSTSSRINPRVDIAFKKIFGVEENKDLLMSLINSIVSDEDQVSDITLLNPYNPKNFGNDKLSVLDIKAKGVNGKRFNIEIQITDEADYDKRALYYWAKLYTEQLSSSEDYSTLSKAIGIHILNFISIKDTEKYHNVFHITEKETSIKYFKDLELHTIELKKFSNSKEELKDLVSKIKNALDIWLAFLTRNELLKKEELPQELNDAKLKKAINVLEVMNFSDQERDAYEDHLKWLRIQANTIKNYEERGEARGMEKGMEKGMEIGKEIGREEGEKLKAIEIARKMLSKKMPIEDIIEMTGLNSRQIDDILDL